MDMANAVLPLFNQPTFRTAELALQAAALRHEAIASNVANVNTPGYRRVDLSTPFQAALRQAMEGIERGEQARTLLPQQVLGPDPDAGPGRVDQNNVNMDKEMVALSRNAAEFQLAAQVMNRQFRQIRTAIMGRSGN
jgi:flagellar basal-body rod protein FlgB